MGHLWLVLRDLGGRILRTSFARPAVFPGSEREAILKMSLPFLLSLILPFIPWGTQDQIQEDDHEIEIPSIRYIGLNA
jgi:hypothetical protein